MPESKAQNATAQKAPRGTPKTGRDIVVVGGSAGALEALLQTVEALPDDVPAALFIVLHSGLGSPGIIPELLKRRTRLTVAIAQDGEPIRRGRIYLPAVDRHLIIKRGKVLTPRGPKQNLFRPAIDPLFRTAAASYGPAVTGVLLSGWLDDGVHGLHLIKKRGGAAIVQDPTEALAPSMPSQALRVVQVDHCVPASEIGGLIHRLSLNGTGDSVMNERNVREAADSSEVPLRTDEANFPPGPPEPYTCPDCGGALWQMKGESSPRYRCHVGHMYTMNTLLQGQEEVTEKHIWVALRAMEEQAALYREVAQRPESSARGNVQRELERDADDLQHRALILRRILLERESPPEVLARPSRGAKAKAKRSRRRA